MPPTTGHSPSSRSRRPLLRRLVWSVAAFVGLYLVLVLTLLALAQGGDRAFVWQPPPMPDLEVTGSGPFELSVSPLSASVDVPLDIAVTGLEPGATTFVFASTTDARDVHFESWARFTANDEGRLDLAATPPEVGSYQSSDASGLLWSMRADDGSLFHTSTKWTTRTYTLRLISDGKFRETVVERHYPFDEVIREDVRGDHWTGQLTVPKGGSPHPAVIVLAGWDDGPVPMTSALIAQRGYAVLNVGYHGWEGVPQELVEIPIETVTEAIDWLEHQPGVDARQVGLYGISRGSELGLLAAVRDPRIVAVAAWVPGSEVFGGISFRSLRQRSSWTWRGQSLPFARAPLTRTTLGVTARLLLRRATSFRPSYVAALAMTDAGSAIPIELIQAEVLLIAGRDDLVWPSAEMSEKLVERARANGATDRVSTLIFDRAGHGLNSNLWPYGDFSEDRLIRGGTPEANHLAGRRAWAETMALFERQLRKAE